MAVNSEGIYSTRPWKTFGSGPATSQPPEAVRREVGIPPRTAAFNERTRKELVASDVHYTQYGSTLYAFSMGWDGKEAVFPELASSGAYTSDVNQEREPPRLQGESQMGTNAHGAEGGTPSRAALRTRGHLSHRVGLEAVRVTTTIRITAVH